MLGARADFNLRSSRCLPLASNISNRLIEKGSVKASDLNIKMRAAAFETEITWPDNDRKVEAVEVFDMENNKVQVFENIGK